jgi:nitrogenase molybdenum-cofactor synthesis protein NifE
MVKREVVKELLNESSCSFNKVKKSSCNRPIPGATSGGCAFEGAQISLFPLSDAVHLVHGPMTCLGASWETRATKTSFEGVDHTQLGFTTDITNNDVIFGGDKKLSNSIDYIMKNYNPSAIFIYLTCVTSLIGDDVERISKDKGKEYNIPIITINAAGFMGSKNLGSKLAAIDVLDKLIGTKEPENLTPYDINLIGEYNVTGDMWQYTHILKEIGINVLSTLSGDGRVDDIRCAHRAKLNVIVCAKSLVALCTKMQEKYNIPYISVSFYGLTETRNSILAIVKEFKNEALMKKAIEILDREEAKLREDLEPYKEQLRGKKAIVNTGGNKSWSFVSALLDLNMEVVATSVSKATEEDADKARELLGENGILMKVPSKEQAGIIDKYGVDILLAGGRSLYTAIKKGVAFADINQEKKISYGAYGGLVNLAKDLIYAIENPVFKNISKVAPWKQ